MNVTILWSLPDEKEEVISELHDIDDKVDSSLILKWYPVFIVLFLFLFYFMASKVFNTSEVVSEIETEIIKEDIWELSITKLRKLKRQVEKKEKSEFYAESNAIIRDFLESLWHKNTQQMTLKEIKKLKIENKNLLELFSQGYTREFDDREDTTEERKILIDSFIKELKK